MTAPVERQTPGRRELLATLVERQFRLRAKRSVLGVLWPLLAPAMLYVIYLGVFGSVFHVPVDDFWAYLLAGLLPWTFVVQTLHDSLQSISFEPELVRRAPFPYETLPFSRVVVMAVPFAVQLLVALVVIGRLRGLSPSALPYLVAPIIAVTALASALALLVALVDVFNRDLRFVLNNILTVWFFLMPILYTSGMRGGWVDRVTRVDPMRAVIEQFHAVLYEGDPGPVWRSVLLVVVTVAMGLAALAVFRRGAVDLAQDV